MSDLPGIVVMGASGRMGQMLIKEVLASDKARLVGALDRPGHDWIGRDVGECMGGSRWACWSAMMRLRSCPRRRR